ncbi:MAG: hypothetical protein IKA23_08550 [Akkermansia sp.]|nr:hypothetical protein [Akkermansia sp.]
MPSLRSYLLLAVSFFLLGCSQTLVPAPRLSVLSQRQADDDLLTRLHADWQVLGQRSAAAGEREAALKRYNAGLLLLIQRLRYDYSRYRDSNRYDGLSVVHHMSASGKQLIMLYDDIVPAADVPLVDLQERYTTPGIGVALVGIIPPEKVQNADGMFNIATRGSVSALTAVLSFNREGSPVLQLIPRQQQDDVRVGCRTYPLAADWSALLEVYWHITRVKDDRVLGLFRPQKLRSTTGLSSLTPYDPDKIPVILTHGLLSSAGTFDKLVNRLIGDPRIRETYQFWYFNYPTGVAWTVSARAYRESLSALRRQVDPLHRNRNWDNMVVVGHSMGGLITHYSQCLEPWELLRVTDIPHVDRYLSPEYIDKPFPVPQLNPLRQDYFFRPVEAGLVVYMATPHRGAPVARYRLAAFISKLVTLPQTLLREAYNIATLQDDMLLLNPQEAYQWFTSIGQLKPDSYSIRGLQGLRVRDVPTHSIIGDRGENTCPKCSDGVVPYWSSHISWGTETIVPYDHSVQDCPESAEDMKRLLYAYALRLPAARKQRALLRCTEQVNHRGAAVRK